MNTLLFHSHEVGTDCTLTLGEQVQDPRAEHIVKVLKPERGSSLRIGEIGGYLGQGELLEYTTPEEGSSKHTRVRIRIGQLDTPPPAKYPLHLILALPRPKSLRRVLRGLANIGVTSVDLIQSYRVEKSYWSAPVLVRDKLESALLEGLSIANDTVLPRVQLFRRFKPYVEDVAATLPETTKLIAHPRSDKAISVLTKRHEPLVLAVGPEGGWTDYEVDLFAKAGFQTFAFGDRVLSVEMALPILSTALFSDLRCSN